MLDKPSIESQVGRWMPLFAVFYFLVAGTEERRQWQQWAADTSRTRQFERDTA
jgi:hypothetical protein